MNTQRFLQHISAPRRSPPLAIAISVVVVFVLALGLRLEYQNNAIVDTPLRADSGKYFNVAFNYYFHGVRSLERPSFRKAPRKSTDLSPGYPLFLTIFFSDKPQAQKIFENVGQAQAVMGSITAALVVLLAYVGLPLGWAFFAGVLTASNPNLIAVNQLLLTETLFTLLVTAGVLISALACRAQSLALAVGASLILIGAWQVRTIGLSILVLLVPIFFLSSIVQSNARVSRSIIMGASPIVAYALFASLLWLTQTTTDQQNQTFIASKPEYQQIDTPLNYLRSTIKPPQFLVDGDSHILKENLNPDWKYPTDVPFSDSPASYIHWNIWGRWTWMWHFDNAYLGDVYIYPMVKAGFDENKLLKVFHRVMQFIHWPLYALSWLGAALLIISFPRLAKTTPLSYSPMVVPAVLFLGFLFSLSLVAWLPRYTIPMRPLSYVLAMSAIFHLHNWLRYRRQTSQSSKAGETKDDDVPQAVIGD